MKRKERWWMYDRYDGGNARRLRPEFVDGVEQFIRFCEAHPESPGIDEVRCPWLLCKNRRLHDANTVKLHLYKKGFIPDYYDWVSHGEGFPTSTIEQPNTYREMVLDALGSNHEPPGDDNTSGSDEEPNAQAKAFQELLKAAEQPLYEGNSMSVLEMASRIVSLKSEYNLPHRCVDRFASLLNEAIPDNNKMGKTFYDTKKILDGLELPHKKIHACPKGCMLFWKADAELDKCRVCERDRYKRTSKGSLVPIKELIYFPITPRLQRLFATKNVADEMTWHSKNPRVQGTMAHPSDSEAWKHLDRSFPDFASEPRNVRLWLSWPVVVVRSWDMPPRENCFRRQAMQIRKLLRKLPHTPSPEPGVGGSGTSTQVPETQDGNSPTGEVPTPVARRNLHPTGLWFDDNTVSTSITNIFQAHWRGPWLNYEMVDKDTKTHWWNSFTKQYLWNADLDALVKEYEKKAHKRLKEITYNALVRNKPVPKWIGESMFERIMAKRKDPVFLERSEKAKKNRRGGCLSNPIEPSHFQGSISASKHAKKMAQKAGGVLPLLQRCS